MGAGNYGPFKSVRPKNQFIAAEIANDCAHMTVWTGAMTRGAGPRQPDAGFSNRHNSGTMGAMESRPTPFPLPMSRVHEACGPGAFGFAAIACAQVTGPVLWIAESWQPQQINPVGFAAFADPHRLLLARTKDQDETLAVAEEALRDGSVPVVVMELSKPLSLTTGRRLQLAAKAGHSMGLCLIPMDMGSNAAATRWHCAPVFETTAAYADSTLQRWELIKNKTGTLGVWHVRWDATAHRLNVVSPAGQ